ncbi:amino acid permease [candidate division KSB1 bacterium]
MKNSRNNAVVIETELSRDLGLPSALAIGIGTMIAAGIFTLSGLAIRNVGSAAVLSFVLAAVAASFTALTFCEFVSIYPDTGGGYLYARKTFKAPLAYFVGWSLFLGYTSSCAFYIASLSSYFNEFIWHTSFERLAGVAALIGLTLINVKGTKETAGFQIFVTTAKIILLAWFISGGMGSVDMAGLIDKFSTDLVRIGGTAALVFITFFGYSAIAASAGDIKNPVRNIPLAILISMGVVTILYVLVIVVVVSAGLTDYTEASMGQAALNFLGPVGGMVIIGGALFSMISASNATIMAGSRVTLSMSRLGHFPVDFGLIDPRTRTPIISLLLVGGTILVFTVSFGLEELAQFANTVLILSLIFVNFALIIHRRKHPKMHRPFRVPLVPLLPVLGIVANIYLLSQILMLHPLPMALAAGCLLAGMLAFLSWKGTEKMELALPGVPSRIALERSAGGEGRYRVLVPIANPASAPDLIKLAAASAAERNGEIIALRVSLIPDQISPSREDLFVERERQILELAQSCAKNYGVPLISLVRIGHNAARAILETARQRDCDLIVLGWKGYTSTARKILGDVVDDVVSHAKTDIMLLKQTGECRFRKILLPSAGGEHARHAEKRAASLIRKHGGSLTLCSVLPAEAPEEEVEKVSNRLRKARERLAQTEGMDVQFKLIRHSSVSVAVIKEAADYDTVMIGASGKSIYPRILFGNIPEMVAKLSDQAVILVKHYHPVKELYGRVMEE